jgi:hypothetical protein
MSGFAVAFVCAVILLVVFRALTRHVILHGRLEAKVAIVPGLRRGFTRRNPSFVRA